MTDAITAPARPTTFLDLVSALNETDAMLASLDGVDLEQLVGDLRDKVDALQYVDAKMKSAVEFFKAQMEPLAARRAALERQQKRLRDYVAKTMRGDFQPEESRQRFHRIPGTTSVVQLYDSQPSLKILRDPTPDDAFEMPDLVELVPERLAWKSDAVKEMLVKGDEADFAKLEQGCFIKFHAHVPEKLESKRKKKCIS